MVQKLWPKKQNMGKKIAAKNKNLTKEHRLFN